MKQLYSRAISRLVFLFALVLAVSAFVSPTSAYARTSCFSDCEAAFQGCLAQCRALQHQPTEGCVSFCDTPLMECLAGC